MVNIVLLVLDQEGGKQGQALSNSKKTGSVVYRGSGESFIDTARKRWTVILLLLRHTQLLLHDAFYNIAPICSTRRQFIKYETMDEIMEL